MKKTIYFLLLLALQLSTYAQHPLQLTGYTPKWDRITKTPAFPDSTYNYEPRRPLIVNDDLYLLSNPLNHYYFGFLLEKLNINSGSTIWTNQYYSAEKDKRKYAHSLKKNGNYIDLFIFKENGRYNLNGGGVYWWESNFNLNRYCQDSGDLCDSLVTNPHDSLNITTQMLGLFEGTNAGTAFFDNDNNSHFYVEYYDGSYESSRYIQRFDIHTIDRYGHRLDSFSVNISCKLPPVRTSLFEYDDKRYVAMIHCENSNGASNNTLLAYFDQYFNLEKTYDVSKLFTVPAGGTYVQSISKDHIVACRYIEQQIKKDSFAEVNNFIVFNHKGERVDYATIKIGTNDSGKAVFISPQNKLLINVIRRPKANRQLEFYQSGPNGAVELLKTMPINKTISLHSLYNAGDNQVLGAYNYRDSSRSQYYRFLPINTHWFMFTLPSLGFSTSTNELALQDFSFYPNPVTHQITVNTTFAYDAIKIYSIEGRMIQNIDGSNTTFDVSKLPSGFYLFELWQSGKAVSKKEKFFKT